MKDFDLNTYELKYLIDFFKYDKDIKSINKVKDFISRLNLYQYLYLINTVIDDINNDIKLINLLFQFEEIQNISKTLLDENVFTISTGSFMDYNVALKVFSEELSKYNDDYDRLINLIKIRNEVYDIYNSNYKKALKNISNLSSFYHNKVYIYKSIIYSDCLNVSLKEFIQYKFGYLNQGYDAFFEYVDQHNMEIAEKIYDENIEDIFSNGTNLFKKEKLILVLPLIEDYDSWKDTILKKINKIDNNFNQDRVFDKLENSLKNLDIILSKNRTSIYESFSSEIKCVRYLNNECRSITDYNFALKRMKEKIRKDEIKTINESLKSIDPLIKLKSEKIKKDLVKTIIYILKDRKVNKFYKKEYIKEIEKLVQFLTEPYDFDANFDISFIENYKKISKVFLYAQHKKLITSNKGEVNIALSHVFNKDKRNFESISIKQIKDELFKGSGIAYYFKKYLLKLP